MCTSRSQSPGQGLQHGAPRCSRGSCSSAAFFPQSRSGLVCRHRFQREVQYISICVGMVLHVLPNSADFAPDTVPCLLWNVFGWKSCSSRSPRAPHVIEFHILHFHIFCISTSNASTKSSLMTNKSSYYVMLCSTCTVECLPGLRLQLHPLHFIVSRSRPFATSTSHSTTSSSSTSATTSAHRVHACVDMSGRGDESTYIHIIHYLCVCVCVCVCFGRSVSLSPFVRPSAVCLPACLSIVCPCARPSVHPSVCVSVCLSLSVSVCLSVSLSLPPAVYHKIFLFDRPVTLQAALVS